MLHSGAVLQTEVPIGDHWRAGALPEAAGNLCAARDVRDEYPCHGRRGMEAATEDRRACVLRGAFSHKSGFFPYSPHQATSSESCAPRMPRNASGLPASLFQDMDTEYSDSPRCTIGRDILLTPNRHSGTTSSYGTNPSASWTTCSRTSGRTRTSSRSTTSWTSQSPYVHLPLSPPHPAPRVHTPRDCRSRSWSSEPRASGGACHGTRIASRPRDTR